VRMLHVVPLEDFADRAQAKRKQALVRISLKKIGIYPNNHGGNAISSHRVP